MVHLVVDRYVIKTTIKKKEDKMKREDKILFKDYLLKVLTEYQTESRNEFAGNKLADFIRHGPLSCDIFSNLDSDKYKIKASVGNGQWAAVPWLSIFDKEITESAQRGYYIVYLFTADLSGVYLSLNQGYTRYTEKYHHQDPEKKIKLVSMYWQANLPFLKNTNGFNSKNINLSYNGTGSALPKGYELGNIFSKFYSADTLTKMSTDEILSQDLDDMIDAYKELKKLLYGSLDEFNDDIIKFQSPHDLTEKIKDENYDPTNPDIILTETPTETPTNLELPKHTNTGNTKRKSDYLNNLKRNTKQGLKGEKLVMKNQRDLLGKDPEFKEYVDKITHLSVKEGDGAGYDILSFKKDSQNKIIEHYIEVKSTNSGKETPFFMSSNELEVAKIKGTQYSIYRLYKSDKSDKDFNYYIINDPYNNIKKEAIQYKVIPMPSEN